MKLLNLFGNVPAIYFPVGTLEDGGTCEFATLTCLEKCAALKNGNKRNKIPYKLKDEIYFYFRNEPLINLCNQIIKELEEHESKILYWFASGDCPAKETERIANIINMLDEMGIVQCGFTRNEKLRKKVTGNVKIVFTVEHRSWADDWPIDSIFGIPDYNTGLVKLYKKKEYWYTKYSCSGPYDKKATKNVEIEIDVNYDCKNCYENNKGCFLI